MLSSTKPKKPPTNMLVVRRTSRTWSSSTISGSLKCFVRSVWHTMLCNDTDVPVVWKRNKEVLFTLAPPGMCPSRLWVSGWVWIWEKKTHKVERFHTAYALNISYSVSGMQGANIMSITLSSRPCGFKGKVLNRLYQYFLLLWNCFLIWLICFFKSAIIQTDVPAFSK